MMMVCQYAASPPPLPGVAFGGPFGDVVLPQVGQSGMQAFSQCDRKIPACSAAGGQQALNSYRNAGAALLQAMQLRDTSHVSPAADRWSGDPANGVLPDGPQASECSRNVILSTSPSAKSGGGGNGPDFGMDAPCPEQAWGRAMPSMHGPLQALPCLETFSSQAGVSSQSTTEDVALSDVFSIGDGNAPIQRLVAARRDGKDRRCTSVLPASMVRNTFIDFKPERSPSVERFFEERKCRSSPVSRPPSPQGRCSTLMCGGVINDDPFGIATPTDSAFPTPRSKHHSDNTMLPFKAVQRPQFNPSASAAPVLRLSQFISHPDAEAVDRSAATVAAAAARLEHEICGGPHHGRKGGHIEDAGSAVCSTAATSTAGSSLLVAGMPTAMTAAQGYELVPGCVNPAVASQALPATIPSRGSALHALGACKPCAFVFHDACANGAECEFCHLCDPGERKRRKKWRRKVAASWKHGVGHEV